MEEELLLHAQRVDPRTMCYLELVSGKIGVHAVEAWLKFTGYDEDGLRITQADRITRAIVNAKLYFLDQSLEVIP